MTPRVLAVPAALVLLCGSHAAAVTQEARVGISTISPCPSFCGGPGGSSEFAFDGGENVTSAFATLTNFRGTGTGSVAYTGDLFLPEIGAESFANPNARVQVDATGLLAYDYDGAASTNISLDFAFDGEATAPDASDARAEASVVVMKAADFPFSTDFGTLVFELIDLDPNVDLVDSEELFIAGNTGPQNLNGSVSIPLDPGDRIAVWAQVRTIGTRGGSADALNTLSLQFSDTAGLTAVIVPSPAAAPLLFLLLAVLHVGGYRRFARR